VLILSPNFVNLLCKELDWYTFNAKLFVTTEEYNVTTTQAYRNLIDENVKNVG